MTGVPARVLFLCTGNSARSILAEALANDRGRGQVVAHSAGSHPKGRVHPAAIAALQRHGVPVSGLASKGWEEFALRGAAPFHYVITVCDNAAGETCPVWPGRPATEHWSIPDPAAVGGAEDVVRDAFETALRDLDRRIDGFLKRLAVGREGGKAR